MPAEFTRLPDDLQTAASSLFEATDWGRAAAVDSFGGATIKAMESEMQRASALILTFEGEPIHEAVRDAKSVLAKLDPSIHKRGFFARLIYAFRSLSTASRIGRIRSELDACAVALARHREALALAFAPLQHIEREVRVGAAVMAAGGAKIKSAEQDGHGDALWREGQLDRILARQTMFDTLTATIATQLNTLEANRVVVTKLDLMVQKMARDVLPVWQATVPLISGLSVLTGVRAADLERAVQLIADVDDGLGQMDQLASNAEQEAHNLTPSA